MSNAALCVNGLTPQLFLKRQILAPSKLKAYAGDKFTFDENGRKFSKLIENTMRKEESHVKSNFSFSNSVNKRLVKQTC